MPNKGSSSDHRPSVEEAAPGLPLAIIARHYAEAFEDAHSDGDEPDKSLLDHAAALRAEALERVGGREGGWVHDALVDVADRYEELVDSDNPERDAVAILAEHSPSPFPRGPFTLPIGSYWLRRPEGAEDDYWSWGGSLHRCLWHLGYALRYNTRAERIELLRVVGDDGHPVPRGHFKPEQILKVYAPKSRTAAMVPFSPLDPGWTPLTDQLRDRLREQIRRFIIRNWEVVDKHGNVRQRYGPVKYTAGNSGAASFLPILWSAVADLEIDPFLWWLESLPPWDGVRRIDTLIDDVLGVEEDYSAELIAAAGWSILGGAVERTLRPGAEHHQSVLIKGKPGLGKSLFAQLLLPRPEFFAEGVGITALHEDKLAIEAIDTAVIVEIAEVSAVRGKIEIDALKKTLSKSRLSARLAYRRDPVRHDCAHVFLATSNDDEPLPLDEGLARRFIILGIEGRLALQPGGFLKVGTPWFDERRDQIWAEALHRVRAGEDVHVPESMYTTGTLAEMYLDDDYDDFLEMVETDVKDGVKVPPFTFGELKTDGFWTKDRRTPSSALFAKAAERRGWVKQRTRESGSQRRVWHPPQGGTAKSAPNRDF